MQHNYTEYNTEHVRQAEDSSAGQPTQDLSNVSPHRKTLTQCSRSHNNPIALALIGIGMIMLLGQLLPDRDQMMGGMVLLTIGSCFLFFALWKHIYGLMIPGCILACLSIGVTFAKITAGVSVLWGLALGFLAILFIGRALFQVHHSWPVYPAVPLFAVGFIVAIAKLPIFLATSLIWVPLLLIGAGLYLGWGRRIV